MFVSLYVNQNPDQLSMDLRGEYQQMIGSKKAMHVLVSKQNELGIASCTDVFKSYTAIPRDYGNYDTLCSLEICIFS